MAQNLQMSNLINHPLKFGQSYLYSIVPSIPVSNSAEEEPEVPIDHQSSKGKTKQNK